MKFTKKKVVLGFVILTLLATIFTLASCNNKQNGEHEHDYVSEVVAPTCSTNGYTKYTCECGDSYTDNETPAAHTMEKVERKEPTCTAEGQTEYSVCSACGFKEGEATAIPMIPHVYTTTYKYPTVTDAGSRTCVCKVCSHTETTTIEALSATLPNASEVISEMIGTLAATVEIEEGSEFVYVTEPTDYTSDTGMKQSVFFEIAEAAIDGKGENLKGHLKLKVGMAEATLTGAVPAKDVVVSKANAEYIEVYIYVNGEDVSIEINDDEVRNENLSELFYETFGQMFGIGDYEKVAQRAYLTQELNKLMPIIENAMNAATEKLPTVSPEYIQHLEELFALVGEDIIKAVDSNGNTVYKFNPVALKKLTEGIKDKTVAEYVKEVYGEDVLSALDSFLETLPNKTVKDIANAAVDFTEGTDVEIGDVYTLIDLYVYFSTGENFSIENEIVNRYDKTLAEVIAEISGVNEENKAEFIASINKSLSEAIDNLETTSVDGLLSTVFMGAEKGFIENLLESIDMLNEAVTLEITVDGNGNVVAINAKTYSNTFYYTINGDSVTLKIVTENGFEFNAVIDGNNANIVVKENGKQVGTGKVTVSEVVNGNDITTTVKADLRDDQNDLLDYTVVSTNDAVTSAKVVLRGYTVDESTDTETFGELINMEYKKLGENNSTMKIVANDIEVTATATADDITFVAVENGETVWSGNISTTETSLTVEVKDAENTLLNLSVMLNEQKNNLLKASVEINGYNEKTTQDGQTEKTFENLFNASYEFIDNASGMDFIQVKYQDKMFKLGYEVTENGVKLQFADEQEENLVSFEVAANGETFTTDAFTKIFGETLLDMNVAVSTANNNGEYTCKIDIALDRLLVDSNSYTTEYVAFDGAINLKIS